MTSQMAQFGSSFVKIKTQIKIFTHVPSREINDFLVELHHLTGCLSKSHAEGVLVDIIQKNKLQVDRAVIEEIISSLCSASPLIKPIEKGGPLSSAFQCKQYYKAKFNVVEPVECILDAKKKKNIAVFPRPRIPASAAE